MSRNTSDPGEAAVSILATTFVVLGGIAACLFMIVTSSPTPSKSLYSFAGGCAATAILLWLLRDKDPLRPQADAWAWLRRRPRKQKITYSLTPRPPAQPASRPRQPPTVDDIRELKQEAELKTWVPNQSRNRK